MEITHRHLVTNPYCKQYAAPPATTMPDIASASEPRRPISVSRAAVLMLVAGASMAGLAGCSVDPDPGSTSTTQSKPVEPPEPSIRGQYIFFNSNANLAASPNGQHHLMADDTFIMVDGKHVLGSDGQDIQVSKYTTNKIAGAINDNGQFIVASQLGVVVNGKWVTDAQNYKLMAYTDDTTNLLSNSVAINKSGHWIATEAVGTLIDGKWAHGDDNQRLLVVNPNIDDFNTWSQLGDDGSWSAAGNKGLISGQVAEPPSDAP